jgi:hypothetical protein
MNLLGSATSDVVTVVIVGLAVNLVVVPVLRNKFENLPKECTLPISTFIPCRGKQYALLECRRNSTSIFGITSQKMASFSVVLSVITDWTNQLRTSVEALQIFFMTNIKKGCGCNRLPIRGFLI